MRSDVKYQILKERKLTVRASVCLSINVSLYRVFVYSTLPLRYCIAQSDRLCAINCSSLRRFACGVDFEFQTHPVDKHV